MQAFKASSLDYVIRQTPSVGLQWNDLIDLLQKLRNCVAGPGIGQWWKYAADCPDHFDWGQRVPLKDQSQPHSEVVRLDDDAKVAPQDVPVGSGFDVPKSSSREFIK